jgi:hypothetical protein
MWDDLQTWFTIAGLALILAVIVIVKLVKDMRN